MYQDSIWKNISPPVNINKLIYNVPSNLTKPFIVLASKTIGWGGFGKEKGKKEKKSEA
jgi:hypothetical protein